MRRNWILGCILIVSLMLTACGGDNQSVDLEKLAKELLADVTFTDELTEASGKQIVQLYNIENATAQFVYISSGATAEEIALFEFSSSEEADKALELAEQRIADQTTSFTNYVPLEVERLENAIVKKVGSCVIVCVSGESQAETIIDDYIK